MTPFTRALDAFVAFGFLESDLSCLGFSLHAACAAGFVNSVESKSTVAFAQGKTQ